MDSIQWLDPSFTHCQWPHGFPYLNVLNAFQQPMFPSNFCLSAKSPSRKWWSSPGLLQYAICAEGSHNFIFYPTKNKRKPCSICSKERPDKRKMYKHRIFKRVDGVVAHNLYEITDQLDRKVRDSVIYFSCTSCLYLLNANSRRFPENSWSTRLSENQHGLKRISNKTR